MKCSTVLSWVKVARVLYIKLFFDGQIRFFMHWFYYDLIILNS